MGLRGGLRASRVRRGSRVRLPPLLLPLLLARGVKPRRLRGAGVHRVQVRVLGLRLDLYAGHTDEGQSGGMGSDMKREWKRTGRMAWRDNGRRRNTRERIQGSALIPRDTGREQERDGT